MSSNFAQCRHYTNFKWPYFRTAGGHYRHMVGHAASPICIAHTNVTFTSSKVKVNSLTFWSFENCTFLRQLPTLFSGGAHDWWVITIVWDIVTTFRSHISEFLPHLVVTWLRTSRNVDITRRGWKLNTFTLSWMILSAFYCACAELIFLAYFIDRDTFFFYFFTILSLRMCWNGVISTSGPKSVVIVLNGVEAPTVDLFASNFTDICTCGDPLRGTDSV